MTRFVRLLLLASLAAPVFAAPPNAEAPFLKENDRAMSKMMTDMNVAPSGDVDRDFVLMMIPHHQGAIDMCRPLLRYGRNPRLKTLCNDIIAAQTREIGLMRRVLAKMGPAPRTGAKPPMKPMPGM